MEDLEGKAWRKAQDKDLWIFDKLIVSRKLGYLCGPVGTNVPRPGTYIVRPCVNIPGMGRDAVFQYIQDDTKHLPSGHFWCEVFEGDHISVDYMDGKQALTVKGSRESHHLYKFSKWEKVSVNLPLPNIFLSLTKRYKYVNVEFIGGNPIEVHLRHNPDFVYGNSIAYPVWHDTTADENLALESKGLRFVEAQDYYRKGFWID